jgi:hypothetical protein
VGVRLVSAETLRRAAALMRERAEAATPGPWKMWDGWGPTSDGLMGVARFGPDSGERVFIHDEQRDLYASRGNWEHIASWHPAVALAVADWLDDTANANERLAPLITSSLPDGWDVTNRRALAVARAYLGEA